MQNINNVLCHGQIENVSKQLEANLERVPFSGRNEILANIK